MKSYLLTKSNEIRIIVGENKLGYETISFKSCMTVDTNGNEVIPPKGKEHFYTMTVKEVEQSSLPIKKLVLYHDVKVVDTNISVINHYKGK